MYLLLVYDCVPGSLSIYVALNMHGHWTTYIIKLIHDALLNLYVVFLFQNFGGELSCTRSAIHLRPRLVSKNFWPKFLTPFRTLIASIKCRLIKKLITRINGISRGESIKPN